MSGSTSRETATNNEGCFQFDLSEDMEFYKGLVTFSSVSIECWKPFSMTTPLDCCVAMGFRRARKLREGLDSARRDDG